MRLAEHLIASAIGADFLLHTIGLYWIGRYLGIAGSALIAVSFLYSLRKRKVLSWGSPKRWLDFHEFLSWAGALMILVHAGVHFNALLPWTAVVLMPFVCETLGEECPAWAWDLCRHASAVCQAVPTTLLDALLGVGGDQAGGLSDDDAALGVELDLCVMSSHGGSLLELGTHASGCPAWSSNANPPPGRTARSVARSFPPPPNVRRHSSRPSPSTRSSRTSSPWPDPPSVHPTRTAPAPGTGSASHPNVAPSPYRRSQRSPPSPSYRATTAAGGPSPVANPDTSTPPSGSGARLLIAPADHSPGTAHGAGAGAAAQPARRIELKRSRPMLSESVRVAR